MKRVRGIQLSLKINQTNSRTRTVSRLLISVLVLLNDLSVFTSSQSHSCDREMTSWVAKSSLDLYIGLPFGNRRCGGWHHWLGSDCTTSTAGYIRQKRLWQHLYQRMISNCSWLMFKTVVITTWAVKNDCQTIHFLNSNFSCNNHLHRAT